jgi:hypothetical protein
MRRNNMKINPVVILLTVFTTCVGWLGFGQDLPAAVGGFTTGVALIIIVELFT